MKLLYITNGINGSGGLERVLSIKVSYLVEKYNYDVTILSLNNNHKIPFYDFSTKIKMLSISVSGNLFNYIKSYKRGIQQIVSQVNPDIILVCDDGLKGFFIPSIIGKTKPIIYERHVSKEIEMHHSYSFFKIIIIKGKWFLMEFLAKRFNAFVVLTEGNKKEWTSLKNMKVISNPLSFYPEESNSLENRKVIAVGKQSYQKGYDLLLKAWKLVVDKYPNWHLDIYGKKEVASDLENLAQKLNIDTTISFHNPEKDIQQKYLESSIYVMSSRYEGFGMVLIEAMACGVPCVSFNCNYGPSDIITDGIDGYVVEKQDCIALAAKIITLIEDENLRKEMGLKAKANVKGYLAINILNQWDDLFKNLLK
jgi:glycosyltransferase involved in cell wall biosynthesis